MSGTAHDTIADHFSEVGLHAGTLQVSEAL